MADEEILRYDSSLSGAEIDVALQDMAQRISERYAKGTVNGTPVTSGQVGYQDNAKYYKDLAQEAANRAESAVPIGTESAVLWTLEQQLSEEAKARARHNIGAVAEGEGGSVQDVQVGGVSVVTNKIANVPLSNPNLLDNGRFQIDQRQGYISLIGTPCYLDEACTQSAGQQTFPTCKATKIANGNFRIDWTSYTFYVKPSDVVRGYVGRGYTFDRWINELVTTVDNGDGTITITNNESTNQGLFQIFEASRVEVGKTYTVSIGRVISGQASLIFQTYQGDWGNFVAFGLSPTAENKGTFTIQTPSNSGLFRVFIFLDAYQSITLERKIKLEPGTVSTLANDVAPNRVVENVKCQNQLLVINSQRQQFAPVGSGVVRGDGNLWAYIAIPTSMRAIPVASLSGGDFALNNGSTFIPCTNFYVNGASENSLEIVFVASGLTVGTPYNIVLENWGQLLLSAEL